MPPNSIPVINQLSKFVVWGEEKRGGGKGGEEGYLGFLFPLSFSFIKGVLFCCSNATRK